MGDLQPYIPCSPLTKPAFPCVSLNSWPGSIRHNSPGATPVTLHPVVCFCRLLLWCLWLLLLLLLLLLYSRLRCWLLCLLLSRLFLLQYPDSTLKAQDNVLEANVMHGNTQAWLLTFETWTVCHLSGLRWFKADIQLVDPGQHDASILSSGLPVWPSMQQSGKCRCRRGKMPEGRETWQRAWRQVFICLYLSNIITIQAAFLEVLAPVRFQGLALIQSAFPAVITLLVGSLHALAMYTESCGTPKLFA